jgi:uncharacterized membrane protein
MKPFLQFIRATLTGGILFLLPVVLVGAVIAKAFSFLLIISRPIALKLPDVAFGLDGSILVAIVLLVLLCFLGGLIFRSAKVKGLVVWMENGILSHLPGYSLVKSITAGAIGENTDNNLITVLVKDDEAWKIGFLSEERDGLCTVFLPEAPRHDSGEVVIVSSSVVKKVNVPVNTAARSLKNYGKGSIEWLMKG